MLTLGFEMKVAVLKGDIQLIETQNRRSGEGSVIEIRDVEVLHIVV